MVKNFVFGCVACMAILSVGAKAQLAGAAAAAFGVQNFDISLLTSVRNLQSQTVAASNVTVYGSTNINCCSGDIGYQIARTSSGSFWVEYAQTRGGGGSESGSIPSSGSRQMAVHTLGIRLMVPLHSRLSVFGAAGGGGGTFHYPWVLAGSNPYLLSNSTVHGVFEFGGGVDLRMSRRISLRGEVRDFVSGRGLSGAAGPHHALALVGVGFHF